MLSSERARWYVNRLRSMPLREIPHRVVEAARRRRDRGGSFAARVQELPDGVTSRPLPALPLDLDRVREGFDAAARERLARDVDALLGGSFTLLGQTWPAGARRAWALDPQSGRAWPHDRFCFDIGRRHGDGPGDVKFVWELSRLQHVQLLALGAHVLGRDDARAAAVGDVVDWFRANPPYFGLGYGCGIELASRVVSVLAASALLGPDAFDPAERVLVWRGLAAHGAWIERYPSLHSSANNHLVAEGGGLFVLGTLAPDVPGAARWAAAGRRILEREAALQILPDGVGAEQSPSYQAYTMEWLLLARHVAGATGAPLAAVVDARLAAGAAFLAAIEDAGGHWPRYGDDDGGVVLRAALDESRYVPSIAHAAGAGGGADDLRSLVYADPASADDPRRESARSSGPRTFRDGGYTLLRRTCAGREVLVLFDHGPLGYGFTCGHGHADALAVWIHVDGAPLVADPGTYRYNADDGWRTYLRGSAAHDTVTLDGIGQSEPTGAFNWGRRTGGVLDGLESSETADLVAGHHDGYRANLGVVHHRSITLSSDGRLAIEDRLAGAGRRTASMTWQFAQDVDVVPAAGGQGWLLQRGHGCVAELRAVGAPPARLVSDATRPGPGAVSTGYNRLAAAPALVFEGPVDLPASWTLHFTLAPAGVRA